LQVGLPCRGACLPGWAGGGGGGGGLPSLSLLAAPVPRAASSPDELASLRTCMACHRRARGGPVAGRVPYRPLRQPARARPAGRSADDPLARGSSMQNVRALDTAALRDTTTDGACPVGFFFLLLLFSSS